MKRGEPLLSVVSGGADPDPELEAFFSAARERAEPRPEQRSRVAQALRAALPLSSVGPGPAIEPAALLVRPSLGAPRSGASKRPAAQLSRVSSKWLVLGGTWIGALSFWLGHSVGSSSTAGEAPRAGGQASAPPPPSAPPPSALPPSIRGAASSDPAMPTPSTERPALPEAPAAEAQIRRRSGAPPTRHGPPRVVKKSAVTKQAPAASMTFRDVLEQLQRAREQLDNGHATMSLILLSELDRGAGELLFEERETARVLALCAAGQNEAARNAAALLEKRSPRSIYSMRLAASCVSESEGLESGEHHD